MRNNREWLIHNLALILGGKNYLSRAGKELEFLKSIYQKAVNAEAIENRLKKEEERIAQDIAVLPYNKELEEGEGDIVVSDDSISDIPIYRYEIPLALTKDHIQKVARMWLDYAKQNMKLKEMVSDIVASKTKEFC